MRKLVVLSIALLCFLAVVRSVFAQTATLTATVRVNPLEVKITAPKTVVVGERFFIEAEVSNLGQTKIKQTKAKISFPGNGILIKGKEERKLGIIPSKKTKTAKWRAMAITKGVFVIQVDAEGIEIETQEVVTDTDSKMINVLSSSPISFFNSLFKLAPLITFLSRG